MDSSKDTWHRLLTPLRWGNSEPSPFDEVRNPFLVDYDRLMFSSSFRRLGKKTQVHPLSRNDHIHNRLSHSLEVSCVGRSLGTQFGKFLHDKGHLPDGFTPAHLGEVVQAACLAHDIGNPAFGHAGEEALRDWFMSPENNGYVSAQYLTPTERADFCLFDGNAQGFRVVNTVEMYHNDGGLRLTYPTLAAMVKYPRSAYAANAENSVKFNFFQTEAHYFDAIFTRLGLLENGRYQRHPLSFLLEAADDTCYRIMDMEDARELKILTLDDIIAVCAPLHAALDFDKARLDSMGTDRAKNSSLRARLINHLIGVIAVSFMKKYDDIMHGDTFSINEDCPPDVREYFANAKATFSKKIMPDPIKTSLEIGSYSLYKRHLDVFIPAAFKISQRQKRTYREERALDLMGVNAPTEGCNVCTAYRTVIDFISGMTDNYAIFLSKQFSGTAVN